MTGIDAPGIGERIARYRREKGISAETLANLAGSGLTRSIVANMEAGRRADIGALQLVAIALVLEVPLVALLVDLDAPDDWYSERQGIRTLDIIARLQGWFVDATPLGEPAESVRDRLYWLEQYASEIRFAGTLDSDDESDAIALRHLASIASKLVADGVELERVDAAELRRRVRSLPPTKAD